MNCKLCNIDFDRIENTIIEETNNFYIIPDIGALVEGYLLIVSKKHILSSLDLTKEEYTEYNNLINKYRELFKVKYNRYPIIFEHGTRNLLNTSASSITHHHTHIVNHNFKNEEKLITELNLKKVDNLNCINYINENYIIYINPSNEIFITTEFNIKSQLMRKIIADDLGIGKYYDWSKYPYLDNVRKTIDKFENK